MFDLQWFHWLKIVMKKKQLADLHKIVNANFKPGFGWQQFLKHGMPCHVMTCDASHNIGCMLWWFSCFGVFNALSCVMGPCMKKKSWHEIKPKGCDMSSHENQAQWLWHDPCLHTCGNRWFFTLLVIYIVLILLFQLVHMRKTNAHKLWLSAQFYILLIPIHWSNGFWSCEGWGL